MPAQAITLTHNGSRPEVIKQLQTQFPDVDHFVLPENRGFTGGANAALQQAFTKSPWCFFITNDCLLETPLAPPPEPGLYAPTIWKRKTTMIDSCGARFLPLTGKLLHFKNKSQAQRFLNIQKTVFSGYFYVPGTAFYIDQSTFLKLSGFDETLHTYWEDVDFSVRAHKANVKMGLCDKTELRHKIGKTCHKHAFYTNFLFQRNRLTVSAKYSPRLWRNLFWRPKIRQQNVKTTDANSSAQLSNKLNPP